MIIKCENLACSCQADPTYAPRPSQMIEHAVLENGTYADPVNHPPHYTNHPSGIECIQITRWMNFNLGNVVKYLWRAGQKTEDLVQDLEKAKWYLEDEIKRLKDLK